MGPDVLAHEHRPFMVNALGSSFTSAFGKIFVGQGKDKGAHRFNLKRLRKQAITKVNGIEKSVKDYRSYKTIKLKNELQVMLVYDSLAIFAGAALSVKGELSRSFLEWNFYTQFLAGAYSDPDEVPGLMHFLEHMLFMGTEKFPNENDYFQYLNTNGGYANAYTEDEETNFYFEIFGEKLEGALERFAAFFIHPLIKPGRNIISFP